MKRFKVTLSTEPEFKIHEYFKLENVVCNNGNGWCDAFNKYESVEDFIDSHAKMAFFAQRDFKKLDDDENYHYYMFIEGLGDFRQDRESGWWKLYDKESIDEFGLIEFYFDDDFDLEIEWSAKRV